MRGKDFFHVISLSNLVSEQLGGNVSSAHLVQADPADCLFPAGERRLLGFELKVVLLADLIAVVPVDDYVLPYDDRVPAAFRENAFLQKSEFLRPKRREQSFEFGINCQCLFYRLNPLPIIMQGMRIHRWLPVEKTQHSDREAVFL